MNFAGARVTEDAARALPRWILIANMCVPRNIYDKFLTSSPQQKLHMLIDQQTYEKIRRTARSRPWLQGI